jgi:formate hydrogenlyase transcriptional activator
MNSVGRPASDTRNERYDAVLHISEALSACREPEELATLLSDQLSAFLSFEHLDLVVFKEHSQELDSLVWGKGRINIREETIDELPVWYTLSRKVLYIPDWNLEERFPRLKQVVLDTGTKIGSVLRVPLTTPHRHLGTLGIVSGSPHAYDADDIGFLSMIARVVAFAIDDGLNLRRAQLAQQELQQQNARLQLLLNLTNRITSNLELREVLRTISASIREVMQCDAAAITLPGPTAATFTVYALDFPDGKGFVKEEQVITPSEDDPAMQLFQTLKPLSLTASDAHRFGGQGHEIMTAEGLKSHCFIPLANRGRALGILSIARRTEVPFTPPDVDFLMQAGGQIAIAIENAVAYHEITELRDKLAQEKLYLEEEIRSEMGFEQIVGSSPALKRVLQLVETVAASDSTVLLLGETGTGKELIARAIHNHSRRKDRTFVKLNCAAIPTGLLESELFGHEKGAFTGAISQKVGRLELADQGTLFLDEIGDIPLEIQPKLLRALQEREFERLGSTRTRKVDIRLIAATNRDLDSMVANREFRSDLFYRLNVFPIRIPPLRERQEDIPLLVSYFVQRVSKQMQKQIEVVPAAVMKGLQAWLWPGNIRELENFIERAVILTRGKSLEAPLAELRKPNLESPTTTAAPPARDEIARIVRETISALEGESKKTAADEHARQQRDEITRALKQSKGRVGGEQGAAAILGVNRTTLISRMKKLGINPQHYA